MEFLTLLIALGLLQLWGSGGPFQQDKWFCDSLNKVQQKYNALKALASIDCPMDIGDKIKATVLENYQIIVTN